MWLGPNIALLWPLTYKPHKLSVLAFGGLYKYHHWAPGRVRIQSSLAKLTEPDHFSIHALPLTRGLM